MEDERQPIGGAGLVWVSLACWAGVPLLAWLATQLRAAVRGVSLDDAARSLLLDPLNLAAIQLGVFGAVLLVGLAIYERGRPVREVLALHPVPVRVVLIAILAGLALQFPLAELSNLAQEIHPISIERQYLQKQLITPEGPFDALVILLALVVVAPVSEELVYRGLLLPGLAERFGNAFSLVATSVAFGFAHGHLAVVAYAIVAGFALGAVRIWTGSLLPVIALHAAANAVPLLLPESLVAIRGFNTVSEEVQHVPLVPLVASTAVAAGALFLLARSRARNPT